MDTIREAFEEWIKTILPTTFAPNLQYKDGKYTQFAMQESWEAWQAATEASAVEIAALKAMLGGLQDAWKFVADTNKKLIEELEAAAIPAGYVLCKAEPVYYANKHEVTYNDEAESPTCSRYPTGYCSLPLYAQETEK